MAPEVGLEPTTDRLTADCSTIELLWKPEPFPSGRKRYNRRIEIVNSFATLFPRLERTGAGKDYLARQVVFVPSHRPLLP